MLPRFFAGGDVMPMLTARALLTVVAEALAAGTAVVAGAALDATVVSSGIVALGDAIVAGAGFAF